MTPSPKVTPAQLQYEAVADAYGQYVHGQPERLRPVVEEYAKQVCAEYANGKRPLTLAERDAAAALRARLEQDGVLQQQT